MLAPSTLLSGLVCSKTPYQLKAMMKLCPSVKCKPSFYAPEFFSSLYRLQHTWYFIFATGSLKLTMKFSLIKMCLFWFLDKCIFNSLVWYFAIPIHHEAGILSVTSDHDMLFIRIVIEIELHQQNTITCSYHQKLIYDICAYICKTIACPSWLQVNQFLSNYLNSNMVFQFVPGIMHWASIL